MISNVIEETLRQILRNFKELEREVGEKERSFSSQKKIKQNGRRREKRRGK